MSTVSVIVPTYNRGSWLPETVASILGQTRPPLEVLIVDDGSTDDTAAICRDFRAPVRYLRQANAGVSAARNLGVREARGEWIAFSDSDDPWEAQKLEVQLKVLETLPEAGWSITGCTVIDLEGRPVPGRQSWSRVFAPFQGGAVDPDGHFAEWLARMEVTVGDEAFRVYWGDAFGLLFLGNVVLPSSSIVRKELLERVGGFDEQFRLAEETEFFHRLAAVAPVAVVMAPLARYRVGQAVSLVSSANMARLEENALESNRRAVLLRPTLSAAEREAARTGRMRLLSRLAYTRLTNLDGAGARSAIRAAWEQGAPRDARSLGIYAASLLPRRLVQWMGTVKGRSKGR